MTFDVEPRALRWRAEDGFAKAVTFRNLGPGVIDLAIDGAPSTADDAFFWGALPRTTLPPGRVVTLQVRPPIPRAGLGLRTAAIPFRAFATNFGAEIQSGAVECRNDHVSAVSHGDLRIVALDFDPPGRDLAGEGEFVDILNATGRELDLAGCRITQRAFGSGRPGGVESGFVAFAPDPAARDFGRRCRLAAGARLRVLTRAKRNGDADDDPLRFYAGRGAPVWNNAGDRVSVYNAERSPSAPDGELVARFGYGSQADRAPDAPQGPRPVTPPRPPRRLALSLSVDVPANLAWTPAAQIEDGDEIEVTTDEADLARDFVDRDVIGVGTVGNWAFSPEHLPSGRPLLIVPRRLGPTDPAPEDDGWPLPGAPRYALIGSLGGAGFPAFAIGAGVTVTATLDAPRMLHLGVNDNLLWDNRGLFRARLRVFRR